MHFKGGPIMYVFKPTVSYKDGRAAKRRARYCWGCYIDPVDGEERRHVLTTAGGVRIGERAAAEAALRDLVQRRERLAVGLSNHYVDAASTPVARLGAQYIRHLRRRRIRGRALSRTYVRFALHVCRYIVGRGALTVADLKPDLIDRAVAALLHDGKSNRTASAYQSILHGLGRYGVTIAKVLEQNPVAAVASPGAAVERVRRALTPREAERLLDVARRRPVAELGRAVLKRKGRKRANWTAADLTPDNFDDAERVALEKLRTKPAVLNRLRARGELRSMFYELAMMTGLRCGEVGKLRWSDMDLDAIPACIRLRAQTTKAGRADTIPLKRSLAEKLRSFRPQEATAKAPVFTTIQSRRAFHLDCGAAGIPIVDDRDRTLDRHSLRLTFTTWLSASGAAPRTAMKLARHTSIDLTMTRYTDDRLLDGVAAVENLPDLTPPPAEAEAVRATGTGGDSCCSPCCSETPKTGGETQGKS